MKIPSPITLLNAREFERVAWLNSVRYILRRRLSAALTTSIMDIVMAADIEQANLKNGHGNPPAFRPK